RPSLTQSHPRDESLDWEPTISARAGWRIVFCESMMLMETHSTRRRSLKETVQCLKVVMLLVAHHRFPRVRALQNNQPASQSDYRRRRRRGFFRPGRPG